MRTCLHDAGHHNRDQGLESVCKDASQAGLLGLLGIRADLVARTHAHWECSILTCGDVNPFRMHDERLCGRGWQTRWIRLVNSTEQRLLLVVFASLNIAE